MEAYEIHVPNDNKQSGNHKYQSATLLDYNLDDLDFQGINCITDHSLLITEFTGTEQQS